MHTLKKSSPPLNHQTTFRINVRMIFVIPAINVTTTLDNASIMRVHHQTSTGETLLRHAAETRRNPCARNNTTPPKKHPLVPRGAMHTSMIDAPKG
jgi:hypothetical protein